MEYSDQQTHPLAPLAAIGGVVVAVAGMAWLGVRYGFVPTFGALLVLAGAAMLAVSIRHTLADRRDRTAAAVPARSEPFRVSTHRAGEVRPVPATWRMPVPPATVLTLAQSARRRHVLALP